jgi:hypothetical protein
LQQEYIRFAYAISHFIAIAAFVFSGWWRRFPVCFAMLLVGSIIAATYAPESREWISGTYLIWEPVAVALRFAAGVEVVWHMRASVRDWVRLASGLSLLALAFAVALLSIDPGSTAVYTFVQIRRSVQVGTAVFMVVLLVFVWSQRLWKWDAVAVHGLILAVLTGKQAAYSLLSMRGPWISMRRWQAADWPGLLITSLCCLTWGILAVWTALRPSLLHGAGHQTDPSAR